MIVKKKERESLQDSTNILELLVETASWNSVFFNAKEKQQQTIFVSFMGVCIGNLKFC